MILIYIAVIIVISILLGILIINYLTIHPLKMCRYLFISSFLFFLSILLLIHVFNEGFLEFTFSILASVLSFIFGYYIRAKQVLNTEDSRYVPELIRSKNYLGKGHTAVIYFTHGEPETYNPIGWINQFKEFDEQKIKFIPFPIRPIFLYILRKKYLQVGKSDHRKMHHLMLKELVRRFRDEGDHDTKFYLSFLEDEPRPDATVIQALNEGATKLVVCEVFVSISNHTAEGEKQIKKLKIHEFNVPIFFTSPLWDSKTLHKMFLEKANAVVRPEEKADVGVLLVGHGQPDQWDEEFPTETEHEIRFRELIIDLFIIDGYKPENLSLAWMQFKKPKLAEKINEFIENGVKKIIFFSAGISADSIHSQYDIPRLVYKCKIPKNIEVVDLGAWNNHPLAIKAFKERIDKFLTLNQ